MHYNNLHRIKHDSCKMSKHDIIYPFEWLAIPKNEVRRFQFFAAITLDRIWFSRNKLVHDAIKPDPKKVIKQVSSSLDLHLSAWKDASLPSLWLPSCLGRIKGNFDVAVRDSFAIVAAVVSNSSGSVILAATLKLVGSNVLQGYRSYCCSSSF
jgi:hypothetical protein